MKSVIVCVITLFSMFVLGAQAAGYDVAAYVWPAYHPAARWPELGIYKDGKGEWQNLYEATKRYPDDHQGVKPLWGYENEADPVVVARKIDAATAAGVNVFIYDWYWYGGRPFLEEALENGFLKAPNRARMKFYIMWANHDVNGLWDNRVGGAEKRKVRWPAKVSDADFQTIVDVWITKYFSQPNYYRLDGKPVLSIYEIGSFVLWEGADKAKSRIAYLREKVKQAGFPGLHLQACGLSPSCKVVGVDSTTLYSWNWGTWDRINSTTEPQLTYRQWGEMSVGLLDVAREKAAQMGAVYFPNITVGWDTNARYPKTETRAIVHGANPVEFEGFARQVRDWADQHAVSELPKLITVNSWNEWTEGTYLEPNDKFGMAYLDAMRRVFVEEPAKRRNGIR